MTLAPLPARVTCRPLTLTALLCCALLSVSARAQTPHAAAATKDTPASKDKAPAMPQMEFEKHFLVLLLRGPSWTPEQTPEVEAIQQGHLAHLRHLMELGKIVVAGPFDEADDKTFRGMCVYQTETREEARKLAEEDPAVKSGRLKVEVLSWFTEKGAMVFPKAKSAK